MRRLTLIAATALLLAGCSTPSPAPSTPPSAQVTAPPTAAEIDIEACSRVLGAPAQYRAAAAEYWPIVEDPDLKYLLQRLTNDTWDNLDWTSLNSLCNSYE